MTDPELVRRLTRRLTCRKCGSIFNLDAAPPKQPGVCDRCSGELFVRDDDRPETVERRLKEYDAKTAAENISAGYHTLAEAFSGWRDSPPHRANMLLKGATRMGIAAVYTPSSKYKVYWALILAEPDEKKG